MTPAYAKRKRRPHRRSPREAIKLPVDVAALRARVKSFENPEVVKELIDAHKAIPRVKIHNRPLKKIFSRKETKVTQAERVIAKFGGIKSLILLLKQIGVKRNESSIYRWTYSKEEGGTGGLIPSKMWPTLLSAARLHGIVLTPDDMDPSVKIEVESRMEGRFEGGKLIPTFTADESKALYFREVTESSQAKMDERKKQNPISVSQQEEDDRELARKVARERKKRRGREKYAHKIRDKAMERAASVIEMETDEDPAWMPAGTSAVAADQGQGDKQ